jgi:hypothetical protein
MQFHHSFVLQIYAVGRVVRLFINSLVVLGMITVVIMVIGNNLARAFDLSGNVNNRFRTAVKETMDIVYIFSHFYRNGCRGWASYGGNIRLSLSV